MTESLDQSQSKPLEGASLGTRSAGRPRLAPALREALLLLAPSTITLAVLLGILQAWSSLAKVPPYILPAPSAVLQRLFADPAFYLQEGLISLGEAMAGLVLGGSVAVGLGILMAHWRALERGLFPLAILVKVTPVVALAPLFIIWFGFGPAPKILVAALICFFPLLANSVTGFRSVNPRLLDLFQSLNASPTQVFIKLRAPSALPYLLAALKITVPLSVIGAVVAEWLGADRGLGHVIFLANTNLDMPGLFAAIAVLAAMGILLTILIWLAERRFLFWHESNLSQER